MENTDIISWNIIALANVFTETFFKAPYATVLQQLRDAEKDRAEKLQAEKAKLKAEKLILKLHVEQGMNIPIIAQILEGKESYIKKVLAKNNKSDW